MQHHYDNDQQPDCVVYEADIAGDAADPQHRYGGAQSYSQQQQSAYNPYTQQAAAPPAYGSWNPQHGVAPAPGGRQQQPVAGYGYMPGPAAPAPAYGMPQYGMHAAAPAAGHEQLDDSLKAVRDLPPAFQPLYGFRYFNPVQSECFDVAYKTDTNMVVSAPTGAGKTGVMELAMLRVLSKHLTPTAHSGTAPPHTSQQLQQQQRLELLHGRCKIIYLGPIKALVQERQADWQARYGSVLGLRCVQLTGDVDDEHAEEELEAADIICSTPEKFDQVTRKVKEKGSMGFFAEIALVLIDEVHLLNEAGRGSSLEAGCVCRIKAVAAVPEMAQAPIAAVRFVAVSATIPNIHDLATWLRVPAAGIRQYGDELRPCKLTTHVKGYTPAKNDFLFERRLNEYVFGIVTNYNNSRPALVFCNSRKGTMDSAAVLVKEAQHGRPGGFSASSPTPTGSMFVKGQGQLQRLQAAAGRTQAKALGAALVAGVGFHHAAMEPSDRELVEGLFKSNDLAVLCTTSTLAMGVNLPAHLVVVKGTTRYVGDNEAAPGEPAGYKEYTQTEVLQMVGRAGRPQFDTEGVAVIMTCRDNINRYKKLLAGQPVESCLMSNLAEHLNAEVVLGTIKDVPGAIHWLKSSFLYTRVRSNPQRYGLQLQPGMSESELDGLLKDQLVMQPVAQLMEFNLIATDEDSYSLNPTGAGKLMAAHFLKLKTMGAIVKLGERPNMPSLLRVICGAEEFRSTSLRRCERKLLNDVNHAADPQQLRHHVMAARDDGTPTGKVKERITTAQEKLFILLNDGLADKPAENLDYSLKQEQDRLLVVGQRIAKCMARYYVLSNSFSAAGRSLLLARSLRAKLWDDSGVAVRQLPSVGKLLGARLAGAGLGSLRALAACGDAHQVEVAAQKPYPWGSELLAHLRSITPPPVSMQLEVLEVLPSRALNCQITLTRMHHSKDSRGDGAAANHLPNGSAGSHGSSAWSVDAAGAAAPGAVAPAGGKQAAGGPGSSASNSRLYNSFTPCKLLCGCSSTDQLLLLRSLVLETFESPLQLRFKVDPPADPSQPISLAARLMLDRIIGLDEKTTLQVAAARLPSRTSTIPHSTTAGLDADDDPLAPGADDVYEQKDAGSRAAGAAPGRKGSRQPQRQQQRQATKRPLSMAGAAAAAGIQGPEDSAAGLAAADAGDVDAGAGAAKHLCGPDRQRQQPRQQLKHVQANVHHQQQSPQQPELQHSSSFVPPQIAAASLTRGGSIHTLNGSIPPGQQMCSNARLSASQLFSSSTGGETGQDDAALGAAGGADAGVYGAAAAPRASEPHNRIAARYNSMLQSGNSRPPAMQQQQFQQQQQHQQQQQVAAAGISRSGAAVAAAASAVDAAGLQITPEHIRLAQQVPGHNQHQQEEQQQAQQLPAHQGASSSCQQQGLQQQQQQEEELQQQQQVQEGSVQWPAAQQMEPAGGLSITSMFDMLADELAWEEEQQQQSSTQQAPIMTAAQRAGSKHHPGSTVQHQQQATAAPAAAGLEDVLACDASGHHDLCLASDSAPTKHEALAAAAAVTAAAGAAARTTAPNTIPRSCTMPQPDGHTGGPAGAVPSVSSVFGAAVLQKHRSCSSLLSNTSHSSSTTAAAAAANPASCSLLPRLPQSSLRSQRMGLAGRSTAGPANSTSSTAEAFPLSRAWPNTGTQQQQQQQQGGLFGDRSSSMPSEGFAGNSSSRGHWGAGVAGAAGQVLGNHPADAAQGRTAVARNPAAMHVAAGTAAAGDASNIFGPGQPLPAADDAELFTPPRQIRRSSNFDVAGAPDAPAAGNSHTSSTMRANSWAAGRGLGQQRSTMQVTGRRQGVVGRAGGLAAAADDMMEYEDSPLPPLAPPSLQEFAFSSGAQAGPPAAAAAAYRPSHNSLMFQRSTPAVANNRALAQAKLAKMNGRTSSARLQSAGGSSSGSAFSQGSYLDLGSNTSSRRTVDPYATSIGGKSQQQQLGKQQHMCMLQAPAGAPKAPPAAPGMQWGGFMNRDHSQQQQQDNRQQATKRARAAWQPAVGGPGARHLLLGGGDVAAAQQPLYGSSWRGSDNSLRASGSADACQPGLISNAGQQLRQREAPAAHVPGGVQYSGAAAACEGGFGHDASTGQQPLQPQQPLGMQHVGGVGSPTAHQGVGPHVSSNTAPPTAVAAAALAGSAADIPVLQAAGHVGPGAAAAADDDAGYGDLDFGAIFDFMK